MTKFHDDFCDDKGVQAVQVRLEHLKWPKASVLGEWNVDKKPWHKIRQSFAGGFYTGTVAIFALKWHLIHKTLCIYIYKLFVLYL